MTNSVYTSTISYKLITRSYTEQDRKNYFRYAIDRLKQCKQNNWDNNIIEFKNGSCRVNYLRNKNIWFSVRLVSTVNDLGVEIKLVMTNALRLSIIEMQHILDTAYQISNVCESHCTVYRE